MLFYIREMVDLFVKPILKTIILLMRVIKKILILFIGLKYTLLIQKCIKYILTYMMDFRMRLIEKIFPTIQFIKPFWKEEEWRIVFGKDDIDINSSLERFKAKFAEIIGISNSIIVPTGSGRAAIELSLKILKQKDSKRKKVIIPSYGCKGTLDPIINNGLIPVYVDINEDLIADGKELIKLFSTEVLACIVVNLTGKKVDSIEILEEARHYGIKIIEDNCQRTVQSDRMSFESDIMVFSFGIGKNLMATTGGAVVSKILKEDFEAESKKLTITSNDAARNRFKYYYNQYFFNIRDKAILDISEDTERLYGYNWMSSIDAEIIILQLNKMEEIINLRKKNARFIIQKLSLYPEIFSWQSSENHIYTKLSVRLHNKVMFDSFLKFMSRCNIELERMYMPLHLRKLTDLIEYDSLLVTEKIAPFIVNIPVRPNLTNKELTRITKAITAFGKRFYKEN